MNGCQLLLYRSTPCYCRLWAWLQFVEVTDSGESKYLENDERAKLENITLEKAKKLKEKFPKNFEIKYLEGAPVHNVVVCDDVCIFGPIFRGLKSRNTPSLVAKANSIPAKAYIDNFEYEWDKGEII